MSLRAAEVEVLFTGNTQDIEKAEKSIKSAGQRIESKPIKAKVDADAKGALDSMDRVEEQAKRIVSAKTLATVDANIESAETKFKAVYERLEYLKSVEPELDVRADISRATADLQKIQRNLDQLRSARAVMEVDADTSGAEQAFDEVRGAASDAGEDAGEELGDNIVAALLTIPIAGAVVGIGVAAGKALADGVQQGLAQEVGRDRLAALTGISEGDALRLARAAGEAYANVYGESIEANMDTARLALQFNILDADASTRDAQKVVEGLAGIADVLGEDIRPVAAAVSTLLSTGIAKNADEAFDIIATGAREGVNRNEDMLDTLTEYPALFARLGLSGEEALGLINQGLDAGARNSDLAADALKEFQIRATDGSETSAEGFRKLGLNAEEMTAKIAAGGEGAREGLDQVLDGLRAIEDPVARNAAAVALFGTQAEDLGEALFAMDLSNAVEQLNGVEGAARRMFDTLADNDATKIEQARRNIEVAAEGIQGALAAAFSEPLGDFAEFVSQNRGPVLQFFLDIANGALDFGESIVIAAADGTEAFGEFVSGPLADMVEGIALVIDALNGFEGRPKELDDLADSMRGFDETTADTADQIRDNLLPGIDEARDRLNTFGDGAVAMGYLNDASLRLAGALEEVGYGADGALIGLSNIDLANLSASESGRMLEDQVRNAIIALQDEQVAASAAGESQSQLADRYRTATGALVGQLVQMGLTEEQAQALIDTVNKTPAEKSTDFNSNANSEKGKVQSLADRIVTLPDGSVVITADTGPADGSMAAFFRSWNGRTVAVNVNATPGRNYAEGAVVEFMANGGLTPMSPIAQMVPANTWRVVGDRGDVSEAYIPLDGSARSIAILMEAIRRMPGFKPMADGGVHGPPMQAGVGGAFVQVDVTGVQQEDPRILGRIVGDEIQNALAGVSR